MDNVVYNGILFAEPVAICATLFVFQLYRYAASRKFETRGRYEPDPRSRLHTLIWWSQFTLSSVLIAAIALDITLLIRTQLDSLSTETLKAHLASRIGILLYFAAGLLPDVDMPFHTTIEHVYTWLVALVFQIALFNFPKSLRKSLNLSPMIAWFAFEAVIAVLLMINSMTFILTSAMQCRSDATYTPIASADRTAIYGTISQKNLDNRTTQTRGDAQSTTWLDYFIGFRALFPYFWPSDSPKYQAITIVCFGLLIAQRVINILVPMQLGVLVDSLGRGRMPYVQLALYCTYRALQGQQGIIGSVRAILWIPISQSLFRRLTCAAYEHVMMLSLDFHLSKRTGEVMAALSKGGALNTFLDGFAFQLFPMVFDIGVAAVYLFVTFNAFYSIVTVGVLWSYVFATIYMAKWRGRQRRIMATRDREMEATKTDAIIAYETVHYNSALPLEMSRFADYVRSFQQAEFSVLFSLNSLNAMQNLMFVLGVVLVAALSAYQISVGQASVASFVTIITYFAQLHAPLAFFGSFYNQVQNNLVDAERMLNLFNMVPDVKDTPNAQPLLRTTGRLEFRNVSFSYRPLQPALKDVSFIAQPGTTTALVGESGSGKSTCLKLIFRFYDTQKGSIRIDDYDVRDVTLESLRQNIGIVPQETVLFNDTIMFNLKYANPTASEEDVYSACDVASIHDKIMKFPDKYDTVVGERGLKISGGEKQRIALARTILKSPVFILLDEATSSLDSQTEKQIQTALKTVTKDRTTIAIAHRLSTITHADQILVMHEGEIVERGTHQSLLDLNGKYAAMWEKQTQTEITKDL